MTDEQSNMQCSRCLNKSDNRMFQCQGCYQPFCDLHLREHRSDLDHQCDEIFLKEEEFLSKFNRDPNISTAIFDKIDRWEKESIEKVKESAEKVRDQLRKLCSEQMLRARDQYNHLAKQFEAARVAGIYLEADLNRWKIRFEQIKSDLTVLSSRVELKLADEQMFIRPIKLIQRDLESTCDQQLVSNFDSISFDQNFRLAIHCGPYRTPTYVTGNKLMDSGIHRTRFLLTKKDHDFIISFNIVSASMLLPPTASSKYFLYGWQSDDHMQPSSVQANDEKRLVDLRNSLQLQIEFIIDCDRKKISYINERTQARRELDIDIQKCPLPWKILFYLYNIGDCVQLLSSSM